ncbi:MAG: porin, partial [Acetobacteraceae bacterium]|nr:porin [Acetobacteraceae bacterium]
PPGKPSGLTFRIPRVDTTIRLYGFAKLNATTDLNAQDQSDALTAQSIQLQNSPGQRQGGATSIAARRSRIGLETWTPINDTWGEFHTQLEMDFAGGTLSANTPATNNSYIPRLRLAYADFGFSKGGWGNFLFGQQASTFNDQVLLPIQWMSDWDFVSLSNVRQAQLRYTYGFANGLSASAAVESPYSDVTTTAGASFPDVNGGGGVGWQVAPDFAGRLMWRDPKIGLLALRGVVRPQINLNNNGATAIPQRFNRGTTGYGVGLTGVVNLVGGKLVLMASGNIGTGLGRYLTNTTNGFGAVSNFGLPGITADAAAIDPVSVYGGMVGAQYFFTPILRTNMSIGGARVMLPSYVSQFGGCVGAASSSGTCSTANSGLWAASINLVWSPFNAVDIGLEYQHIERSLQGRNQISPGLITDGGEVNRIELTTIGRF